MTYQTRELFSRKSKNTESVASWTHVTFEEIVWKFQWIEDDDLFQLFRMKTDENQWIEI